LWGAAKREKKKRCLRQEGGQGKSARLTFYSSKKGARGAGGAARRQFVGNGVKPGGGRKRAGIRQQFGAKGREVSASVKQKEGGSGSIGK